MKKLPQWYPKVTVNQWQLSQTNAAAPGKNFFSASMKKESSVKFNWWSIVKTMRLAMRTMRLATIELLHLWWKCQPCAHCSSGPTSCIVAIGE
eukprot:7174653-Ditylum_brightwellii.AAC.1